MPTHCFAPGQLNGEDLEAPHEGGKASEGRLSAASHSNKHRITAWLAQHSGDAGYVLHSIGEEH